MMDTNFSRALQLNAMSSTTSLVVWSMIAFLVLLVLITSVTLKSQMDKIQANKQFPDKDNIPKGF